jgi:hypothetical protein
MLVQSVLPCQFGATSLRGEQAITLGLLEHGKNGGILRGV